MNAISTTTPPSFSISAAALADHTLGQLKQVAEPIA